METNYASLFALSNAETDTLIAQNLILTSDTIQVNDRNFTFPQTTDEELVTGSMLEPFFNKDIDTTDDITEGKTNKFDKGIWTGNTAESSTNSNVTVKSLNIQYGPANIIDALGNVSCSSLKIGGQTVVNSARNIYATLYNVNGVDVIDGSNNHTAATYKIGSTTVIDASKNMDMNSYKINGTEVISSGKSATFNSATSSQLYLPFVSAGYYGFVHPYASTTLFTGQSLWVTGSTGYSATMLEGRNATAGTQGGIALSGAGNQLYSNAASGFVTMFSDLDLPGYGNVASITSPSGAYNQYCSGTTKWSIRKKENNNYLDRLNQLNVYSYSYRYQLCCDANQMKKNKDGEMEPMTPEEITEMNDRKYYKNKKLVVGLIAEEVAEIFDNATNKTKLITVDSKNEDDYKSLTSDYVPSIDEKTHCDNAEVKDNSLAVSYNALSCYTILALQELTALVKQQSQLITDQRAEIDQLKMRVTQLEPDKGLFFD